MRKLRILAGVLYLFLVATSMASIPKEPESSKPAACASCPDFNQRWIYYDFNRIDRQLTEQRLRDYAKDHNLVRAGIGPDVRPYHKGGRAFIVLSTLFAILLILIAYWIIRRYDWRDMS